MLARFKTVLVLSLFLALVPCVPVRSDCLDLIADIAPIFHRDYGRVRRLHEHSLIPPPTVTQWRQMFDRSMLEPDFVIGFFAVVEGEKVGYVIVDINIELKRFWIRGFFVRENMRRQGLGLQLLDLLDELLTAETLTDIDRYVAILEKGDDYAFRWLSRFGFQSRGLFRGLPLAPGNQTQSRVMVYPVEDDRLERVSTIVLPSDAGKMGAIVQPKPGEMATLLKRLFGK